MVKVALDAGHGLTTPGKRTPDGVREWTFNNKVLLACIDALNTYEGVQILRLDDPTGNTDVTPANRTNKANSWKADVLISIHHNADKGVWANHTGAETYTMDHPNANPKSVEIAKCVQPRIAKAMGIRDRGIKKANFHMLRESKMPAILTEGGFMDSLIDIKAMNDDAKLRAQGVAIAEGLADYYKLKKKVIDVPTKPSPTRFSDVPKTHTAYEALEALYEAGIVKGHTDGTYRPNEPVTRAHHAIMLYRLLKALKG